VTTAPTSSERMASRKGRNAAVRSAKGELAAVAMGKKARWHSAQSEAMSGFREAMSGCSTAVASSACGWRRPRRMTVTTVLAWAEMAQAGRSG
jgi:hypothetical protein